MKQHVMIAFGLLMLVLFGARLFAAISSPGWGVAEAYAGGGLVLGGWLIKGGLAEWRHARRSRHNPAAGKPGDG